MILLSCHVLLPKLERLEQWNTPARLLRRYVSLQLTEIEILSLERDPVLVRAGTDVARRGREAKVYEDLTITWTMKH